MGTETEKALLKENIAQMQVKLNNPLMGTETLRVFVALVSWSSILVKLNNPLMGTETLFPFADLTTSVKGS